MSRETFDAWWNADTLTPDNNFRPGSPAYWAFEGWQAATAAAIPPGMVLVPESELLEIKDRVNTLAALSLKVERYQVGRSIKQSIAAMLQAAKESKT